MPLNGGNAPLAEINKNSGAHPKNRKISTKIDLYCRLQNVGLVIYFPEI